MSSNQQVPNSVNTDDEITLRDLILKVIEFIKEGWRYKWLILATSIVVAVITAVIALLEPKNFKAEMTFMLNSQEGGASTSPFSSILKSFGGSSSGGGLNLDRLVYLTNSREIIYSAIFDSAIVKGKEDFIANHIIKEYDMHKAWRKDTTGLKDFLFMDSNLSPTTRLKNRVADKVFKLILNEDNDTPLVSCKYAENTRILTLTVLSTSSDLAYALHESLYKYLSDFYVTRTIEQQQTTYNLIKTKVDSLRGLLHSLDRRIAKEEDSSRGIIDRASTINKSQIERERRIISVAYSESARQLEIANFSLKSNTPIFQIIDEVRLPLSGVKTSLITSILIGGFLGGFLGVIFVFVRKVVRDTMDTGK